MHITLRNVGKTHHSIYRQTCLSNHYMMDSWYELCDSLLKFTEVQPILHRHKSETDPQPPTEPANCRRGNKKCAWHTKTSSSHKPAQTHKYICLENHMLPHPRIQGHLYSHSHTRAPNVHVHVLRKMHASTHPRESNSKWTSQPSKVLTSIRHAHTVGLPADGELHLSARSSAKQFQRKEKPFYA